MEVGHCPGLYGFQRLVFHRVPNGSYHDHPGREYHARWPVLILRYASDTSKVTNVELDPSE